jgi:hypothetical protein
VPLDNWAKEASWTAGKGGMRKVVLAMEGFGAQEKKKDFQL